MATFCDYLLRKGRITSPQLARARSQTNSVNLPTGGCAYAFGFMDQGQIRRVLGIQHRTGQRFGEVAVALGYLSGGQLHTVLRIQEKHRVSLEDALVDEGALTREEMESERRSFESGRTGYLVSNE
jgi:hypothetical protein